MVSTLRVDIGALVEQQLYDLLMASILSHVECVAVLSALRVDIGALVEK